MTHQEILEKAIQKAIDGGWAEGDGELLKLQSIHNSPSQWNPKTATEVDLLEHHKQNALRTITPSIIFNHDFAKALWGDDETRVCRSGHEMGDGEIYCRHDDGRGRVNSVCGAKDDGSLWQYHLQQMVIADDPIEYLGQNID